MKRVWIIILLSVFLSLSAYPSGSKHSKISEDSVATMILFYSKKYNLDPSILYTLAHIESDFEPLAIAVETNKKSADILESLRSDEVRVVYGKRKTFHSKRSIISLYPKNVETASYIAKLLEKYGFCFDVGLMQINTVNFKMSEVENMFYPEKNIKKAAEVFSSCKKRFSSLVHQVECYNRGAGNLSKDIRRGKKYYPYWNRFNRKFKESFGVSPRKALKAKK